MSPFFVYAEASAWNMIFLSASPPVECFLQFFFFLSWKEDSRDQWSWWRKKRKTNEERYGKRNATDAGVARPAQRRPPTGFHSVSVLVLVLVGSVAPPPPRQVGTSASQRRRNNPRRRHGGGQLRAYYSTTSGVGPRRLDSTCQRADQSDTGQASCVANGGCPVDTNADT